MDNIGKQLGTMINPEWRGYLSMGGLFCLLIALFLTWFGIFNALRGSLLTASVLALTPVLLIGAHDGLIVDKSRN